MSIKRTNEGGASPPPLKRQKIGAASSSSAVSTLTAQSLLQKLQSAEVGVAILEERLQSAEVEVVRSSYKTGSNHGPTKVLELS